MSCDFLIGVSFPLSWNGFWRLSQWSLGFLYVWPMLLATLALAGNLAAAMALKWPFRRNRWRREYWLIFLSLLFVPATIAVADIGWATPNPAGPHHPNTLALWICNGMILACVILAIFWVYRMKGLRWFAVAVGLIELWLLMAAGSIAGMALTGDWL